MGLFKRLVNWVVESETKRIADKTGRRTSTRRPAARPRRSSPPVAVLAPPVWLPADHPVTIQGFDLPDGMIYVGQQAGHPHPSMINPVLPIDVHTPNAGGAGVETGRAYSALSPHLRTAYLDWLSTGRRRADAPIGFPFLFFYGLERRVLVDLKDAPGYDAEIDGIRNEVSGLLEVYGPTNPSFDGYARGFLDVLDFRRLLVNPALAFPPPHLLAEKRPAPMLLQAELARIAADKCPLPPDRALAWAWFLPDVYPKTPALRCKREFVRLFMIRYMAQFGDGLTVTPGRRRLEISYRAASSGIGTTSQRHPHLLAVFEQAEPPKRLKILFNRTSEELEPYSRWLGRNPEGAGSLTAVAMLPPALIGTSNVAFGKLRTWAEEKLGTQASVAVASSELISLWAGAAKGTQTKSESIQVAQLLGRLTIGLEPDPRFGGPPLTTGKTIVLFRSEVGAPEIGSPEYAAASLLVHLAAAVGTSDGAVSSSETGLLGSHLETALRLTTAERRRLQAHLGWLATADIKLTGLNKRFAAIEPASRAGIGELLVTIASADGVVSPAEVATLSRIYGLLGLDPAAVTRHLHSQMTNPRRGPVVVRSAIPGEPGVHIPDRPGAVPVAAFSLDAASIQAKLVESAAVSLLLGSIFVDDSPVATNPAPSQSGVDSVVETAVAGLDCRHSGLFHQLVTQPEWTREAVEAMAASAALMPNGAIDTLNEAAYEIAGEPLLDGDDPIVVNSFAREAMTT